MSIGVRIDNTRRCCKDLIFRYNSRVEYPKRRTVNGSEAGEKKAAYGEIEARAQ